VTQCIKQKSHECREMFKKGINDVLDRLRQSINEPEDDDPSSKPEFNQKPTDASQPKQIVNTNPTLEALGFNHNLKYGPRSKLRKACSKFLRFSYLLDFLATEALTNIYLFSVRETIDRLDKLTDIPVEYQFKSSKAPYESNVSDRPATGNKKEKGETRIRSYTQEQPFF
jgi:dynein heavy chain